MMRVLGFHAQTIARCRLDVNLCVAKRQSSPNGETCWVLYPQLPFKFEAANYWDHDFKIIPNQKDLQACARACDENPDCKVVTFADATIGGNWANTCVLRNAIGPRHAESPGFCSWVKPAKAAH